MEVVVVLVDVVVVVAVCGVCFSAFSWELDEYGTATDKIRLVHNEL